MQIIAARSKDIPSHDTGSTFEQPNYAAINKKKKKTMGKDPVHYGLENIVATNHSLAKHNTAKEIHLLHTADENRKLRQRNAVCCNQQKDGSPGELYTAVRKKTKESTAQDEEEQPPIPPQGVVNEQLYTAVNKKTQLTTANGEVESPPIPPHTVEQLYTAITKKPKPCRETDNEVEAPPVPPHRVEELYTAVQKNKK